MNPGVRVDHAVIAGSFSLDGQTFAVDNNVWVVGDNAECIVIDAPHDARAIMEVVRGRTVRAIVCTHAHDDHVRVAPELRGLSGAPILLHPGDRPVWELTHPREAWDEDLSHDQELRVGDVVLRVLHTPGHSPGSVCLYVASLDCVFTGDTLFQGGPGATGRSFSDGDQIIASIRAHLLSLPGDTVVHTGHGADTTLTLERATLAAERVRQLLGKRMPGDEVVP